MLSHVCYFPRGQSLILFPNVSRFARAFGPCPTTGTFRVYILNADRAVRRYRDG